MFPRHGGVVECAGPQLVALDVSDGLRVVRVGQRRDQPRDPVGDVDADSDADADADVDLFCSPLVASQAGASATHRSERYDSGRSGRICRIASALWRLIPVGRTARHSASVPRGEYGSNTGLWQWELSTSLTSSRVSRRSARRLHGRSSVSELARTCPPRQYRGCLPCAEVIRRRGEREP